MFRATADRRQQEAHNGYWAYLISSISSEFIRTAWF